MTLEEPAERIIKDARAYPDSIKVLDLRRSLSRTGVDPGSQREHVGEEGIESGRLLVLSFPKVGSHPAMHDHKAAIMTSRATPLDCVKGLGL